MKIATRDALRHLVAWAAGPGAGYVAAVLGVAVATLVALALGLGAEAGVFAPFLVVVVAVALTYGTGPASTATIAAMIGAYWWLLGPVMMLVADIDGVRRLALFRLAIFGLAAATMVAFVHRHRRKLDDLERTRRQLLTFMASDRIGLQAVEHDGRIVWEDPTAAALLGDGAADHVGCHLSRVLADPMVAATVLRRLARGMPVENVRARVCCADGSTRDVLLNSNTLLGDAREPGHAVLLALMPLDGLDGPVPPERATEAETYSPISARNGR